MCLEKGENLLLQIPGIILRFRLKKFGVVSDIKQAFLQIGIRNEDRDFLRFLWFGPDDEILEYRHCRVVFGVVNSPFMLAAVIHHLLDRADIREKYSNKYLDILKNNMYVDNAVASFNFEDELRDFINEASKIMYEGKFILRGWEYSGQDGTTKVLGLNWDKKSDCLCINPKITIPTDSVISKRLILSFASKIFDPIGFTSPISIWPKVLIQKIWKRKLNWDQEVDEDIKSKFLIWLRDLDYLKEIKIPRCILTEKYLNLSVHTFCDSSQEAY